MDTSLQSNGLSSYFIQEIKVFFFNGVLATAMVGVFVSPDSLDFKFQKRNLKEFK